MSLSAAHSVLELLTCNDIEELLTRFSAQMDELAPGCSLLSGMRMPRSSLIECRVSGSSPSFIQLDVNDFRHPLAQVIRSGKPAVWLSLNFGARIEHPAFKALVQCQKNECGLYAFPFVDHNGQVSGVWAALAPSITIAKLVDTQEPFQVIAQVFQHRIRELSQRRIHVVNGANNALKPADGVCIAPHYVDLLLERLQAGKPVALTGESGTGKTWLAHHLHACSRDTSPLLCFDCAVLSEEMQGLKLFGENSVAGAALVKAHRGYLLLENIDALATRWHAHLQHFLDTNEVISCDARDSGTVTLKLIVTCTRTFSKLYNLHPKNAGFYHRFCGGEIYMPPLRDRMQDINLICEILLRSIKPSLKQCAVLSKDVLDALLTHTFPGNIRELENIIRIYIISLENEGAEQAFVKLTTKLKESQERSPLLSIAGALSGTLKKVLTDYETMVLRHRLEKYNFDKERVAKSLSISRRSLDMKCKRAGISR